jgi:hypothetical protein
MSLTSYRAAPPRATKIRQSRRLSFVHPRALPCGWTGCSPDFSVCPASKAKSAFAEPDGCCSTPRHHIGVLPNVVLLLVSMRLRIVFCKSKRPHARRRRGAALLNVCVFVFEKMILFSHAAYPKSLQLFGRMRYDRCVWQTWQRPTLPRLETKYHWRRGVSRPSSEWDRVQPPRCNHQVSKAQRSRMRVFRRMRYK